MDVAAEASSEEGRLGSGGASREHCRVLQASGPPAEQEIPLLPGPSSLLSASSPSWF